MTKLALLLTIVLLATPLAAAHASSNSSDGKVRITWGWTDEPAYSGQKNNLDLILRDNATQAPITGVENLTDLEVSIHYGGDEEHEYTFAKLKVQALPDGTLRAGRYTGTVPIIPASAGIYQLHLKGTINGSVVDVEIPASHPVEDAKEITFPENVTTGADAAKIGELESRVAALEAKAKTQSETPATTTPQTGGTPAKPAPALGIALVGVAAVGVALALRRRS